jgi:hypothetical protein
MIQNLNFYKTSWLIIILGLYSSNIQSQDTPIGNKIVGNGDPVNYYIGHFPVSGSDGLDLHWYGGIRFGDWTSNSVMQITNGKVGIGTISPIGKLDIVKTTATNDNDVVANFIRSGGPTGGSSIVRFGYHNTCDFEVNSGYSSTGHRFGSYFDLNIANNFTGGVHGGINLATNGTVKMAVRPDGNIGIGTSTPTEKLEIAGKVKLPKGFSATNAALVYTGDSDYMFIGPQTGTSANGAGITLSGSTNQQTAGGKGSLMLYSSGGSGMTIIGETANVGIGTINPDSKLTVKGKIHAEEVKIDLAVPADYVFEKYYLGKSSLKPDYTLLTLSEVEKFTAANHHLPNVPSAKEIKENGLLLGEMSNVLLQKIEELTLYSIDQQKTIKKQATAIEKLEKENESFKKLEERLIRLEKELETKK